MNIPSFFDQITQQYAKKMPFVVFRKPGEKNIQALLQEDTHLHEVKDFTESGFVFAPFDNTQKIYYIPEGNTLNEVYESNPSFVTDNKIPIPELENSQGRLKEFHIQLVRKGMEVIVQNTIEKVVLSRKHVQSSAHTNPLEVLQKLLGLYPQAFVYCWFHPKVGLWIGATPETLVEIENHKLRTMALAGTQKYEGNVDVIWGAKEKEEQQLVTDTIVEAIGDCVDRLVIGHPETHRAGNVLHIRTDIHGVVHTPSTHLKTIINKLHPTPAVCGLPLHAARQFILDNEGYNRSFYTGFLGELNISTIKKRTRSRRNTENRAYGSITKRTHLFVNLRCLEWMGDKATLYVGGGITAGSDPEAEWEETVHKTNTLLQAF